MSITLDTVKSVYERSITPIDNDELYSAATEKAGLPLDALNVVEPIGKRGEKRNPLKRQIRWMQQTLKQMGVIEQVGSKRGVWALTDEGKKGLNMARPGVKLIAYSTNLGVAIWGDTQDVLRDINEPIHLCLTSPPYPLKVARNYGNVDERGWVEFIIRSLDPVVKSLVAGGSVVLNVSNDIFESKSPARSMYLERMVLALHDELGLSLMDRWQWVNPSKPPGPTWWACRERKQLCSGYEPVFWFTNDPLKVRSNNNRVLEPHSEQHKKFLADGGNKRTVSYGDGAYKLRPGSFGRETEGKIPKNVLTKGHACSDTRALREHAKRLGLPPHSAMFPSSLAEFAIKFLTEEDELVVDLFSGSNKSGLVSQRLNRRWIAVEKALQYIRTQAEMFRQFPEFYLNPEMQAVEPKDIH